MQQFNDLGTGQDAVLTFDMTQGLNSGELLTGTPVATVTLIDGTDAFPNELIVSTVVIDATQAKVLVPVLGVNDGCDYIIKVTCNTTNTLKNVDLSAIISVRAFPHNSASN